MSLYAEYLRERTDDDIVENEKGFATYRFLNEQQIYIVDLYVKPEFRKMGVASSLADEIIEIGKAKGCVQVLGTVVPATKNSTKSLQVLFAYGMTLMSASQDLIIVKKDI